MRRLLTAQQKNRSAYTIVEMIVAMVLFGVLFSIAVPILRWSSIERRASDQRQMALLEAANIHERISLIEWETLSSKTAGDIRLSESCRNALRNPRLKIHVEIPEDEPLAKRILLELTWEDRTGNAVSPVRLIRWTYRTSP